MQAATPGRPSAAEGLAQDHREAGDGGLGERVQQLGAMADHAARLLRAPVEKAGVSTRTTSGIQNALHVRTKRAAFCEASASMTPAIRRGWILRDVDVVLETIGRDYGMRSLATLRRGGILVWLTGPLDPEVEARGRELGIRTGFTLVEPDRTGLLAITELVESGKLRVEIADVLPLADAAHAHRLGESNRTTGKLVLRVRG